MIRKFTIGLVLFAAGLACVAQSPYNNNIFPLATLTATSQTSTVIPLGAFAGSYSGGVLTVSGLGLTTVTFAVQASADGGVNYVTVPTCSVAVIPTCATTQTVTSGPAMFQINLVGITHVRFVTSSTFTASQVYIQLTGSPNASVSKAGTSGGGFTAAGDLSGTSSSQTVIGINGTLISPFTGLLKLTAGVPSTAVAGTDYLLPAGSGAALTALNATNIASGTLADARLSSNVALLNFANTFTAAQIISSGAAEVSEALVSTATTGTSVKMTSDIYVDRWNIAGPGAGGYAGGMFLFNDTNTSFAQIGLLSLSPTVTVTVLPSGNILGWCSGLTAFQCLPDTTFTRTAAGTIGVGTGAPGSTAGKFAAAKYLTDTNCSSAASPAVCGSAAAGSVVIATAATTVVVNTTAVTANSQIVITPDESLGTKLGVTCNSTAAVALATFGVTARTAGTSFTLATSGTVTINPACYTYQVIN